MKLTERHVGIWGYGRVGQSIAHFLQYHNNTVTVYDRTIATPWRDIQTGIQFYPEHTIKHHTQDFIIPSPGIDINQYPHIRPQCVSEYDAFHRLSNKPKIGITGSLGKTTVTASIAHTLQTAGIPTDIGGNIGVPLFSLLDENTSVQYHVLELSSFQLEHVHHAAPDIAVMTNFHPNHLDRHTTTHAYLQAKCNIFRHQTPEQHAILPISMRDTYTAIHPDRHCHLFAASREIYNTHKHRLYRNDVVYMIENNAIYRITDDERHITDIPCDVTFDINWLIVTAVCDILGCTIPCRVNHNTAYTEHRREYIGMHKGVHWYNDSKATIMPATCAAVTSLAHHRIILLLGGTSKGVNRKPYIQQLAHKVGYVVCWGDEAQYLYDVCQECGIPAHVSTTLQQAVHDGYQVSHPHDTILLSPGGASFDQFSSYQERGLTFKKLVTHYM